MPTEPKAPKRRVSQAPIKLIACYGACGATVASRTTPRVYCELCRTARVRASARAAMEKQRRKRGIVEVKGAVSRCEKCGDRFALNRRPDAKWCDRCRPRRYALGASFRCMDCDRSIPRTGRRGPPPSRCSACRPEPRRRWARMRMRTDPHFALNNLMSNAIRKALRGGKVGRWRDLVDYSVDELARHIERQFMRGMSWSNRDRWHIDHIIPLSKFNFTTADDPEFKLAWAMTNLRPLWKRENLLKGGQRTLLL